MVLARFGVQATRSLQGWMEITSVACRWAVRCSEGINFVKTTIDTTTIYIGCFRVNIDAHIGPEDASWTTWRSWLEWKTPSNNTPPPTAWGKLRGTCQYGTSKYILWAVCISIYRLIEVFLDEWQAYFGSHFFEIHQNAHVIVIMLLWPP